ncbi:MAG: hypothetical protein ACQERX_03810 [Bacillota bacterium]
MLEEKWKSVVGNIKDNFEVEDSGSEHIDEEGGIDVDYIVFQGPLGRMRLEFISKPVVLDKKTNYSKRIGSETQVTYVYSEEEKNTKMIAYKWDENDENWVEIEAGMFGE